MIQSKGFIITTEPDHPDMDIAGQTFRISGPFSFEDRHYYNNFVTDLWAIFSEYSGYDVTIESFEDEEKRTKEDDRIRSKFDLRSDDH